MANPPKGAQTRLAKYMKTYELTYIVSPEITSEDALAKAKEIESAIQSREGTIVKQLTPVAKALSYPIKKRASGFFGVIEFQLEPEKLLELKEILEKDGNIVRHMVIIKEALEMKKERRTRTKTERILTAPEFKIESRVQKEESPVTKTEEKPKVELKDIEQKLDEILGQ